MATKGDLEPMMHLGDNTNITSGNAESTELTAISDFISDLLEVGSI